MDGTLHDSETLYLKAVKAAAVASGFELTDEFCLSLIGHPKKDTIREHLGETSLFKTWELRYLQQLSELDKITLPLKRGALEVLEWLSTHQIPVALATSASRRRADHDLARSSLGAHLSVVVTGSDVIPGRGKPHPDIFLKAAERLGMPPGTCVAVEDSYTGIRAAHAAGMMPVMVPDLLPATPDIIALCVAVLADLQELPLLLQSL